MQTNFTLLEVLPLKRHVTVREMTVAEIDLLSDEECTRLTAEGLKMNEAFFSGNRGQVSGGRGTARRARTDLGGKASEDTATCNLSPDPLNRAVARMVRCGHTNAWDYPWAVFVAAVEDAEGAGRDRGSDVGARRAVPLRPEKQNQTPNDVEKTQPEKQRDAKQNEPCNMSCHQKVKRQANDRSTKDDEQDFDDEQVHDGEYRP
ncbi:hypothetical protein AGMMS49545_22680 [Betaproteobacteria bacterium]|nr:hypothetical protein AGMMS49545_22680 [Betaproteobacteria bacterium]GHU48558.1 hypothetical protein AGMMS50289_25300 [Betaproteobacteria bacterium]